MGTAVSKKKDAALPVAADLLEQMAGDAGAGMEDMTAKDYAIPFLHLLQALSPQVQEGDPKYIEGARPGDFINSVTGDLYKGKDGLRIIPVRFQKMFNEWVPRAQGGGFVTSHPTEVEAVANAASGNEVVETALIYSLVERADGTFTQALLSLTSTKLKVARKWNSLARMRKLPDGKGGTFTPPYFGVIYRLTSVSEKNDKGQFFNLKVEEEGLTIAEENGLELYQAAKDFLDLLRENRLGADFNKAEDVADAEGDDLLEEDDLPF